MTAESASSSGTPAATSAPNTISRTSSVSGTDRSPAFASCELNALLSALPELIEPASPTKKPGMAVGDPAGRGGDRVDALLGGLRGAAHVELDHARCARRR